MAIENAGWNYLARAGGRGVEKKLSWRHWATPHMVTITTWSLLLTLRTWGHGPLLLDNDAFLKVMAPKRQRVNLFLVDPRASEEACHWTPKNLTAILGALAQPDESRAGAGRLVPSCPPRAMPRVGSNKTALRQNCSMPTWVLCFCLFTGGPHVQGRGNTLVTSPGDVWKEGIITARPTRCSSSSSWAQSTWLGLCPKSWSLGSLGSHGWAAPCALSRFVCLC